MVERERDSLELGRLLGRVDALERDTRAIDQIRRDYVTKAEYEPVKWIAFGIVATIAAAVLAAMIALVVRG